MTCCYDLVAQPTYGLLEYQGVKNFSLVCLIWIFLYMRVSPPPHMSDLCM